MAARVPNFVLLQDTMNLRKKVQVGYRSPSHEPAAAASKRFATIA
jgi:hypothetical protein